ncbi:MAG: acylphosphatase [Variibacter sp.]|nr:acylphosphatase [Variibacter sp.]
MSPGETVVRHIVVRGRVQGVGYRAWVENEAILRGLDGFVRNRRDGSVEALFAGPPEAVAEMVTACRRGPAAAHVPALEEKAGDPRLLAQRRPGERFSVLPTL